MVEGTAVTESLHKWNTTPCTIASHKPELWCKCFSNMAWIYPCILRLKNAFFTSFKQETKEGYEWYTQASGSQMDFMQTFFEQSWLILWIWNEICVSTAGIIVRRAKTWGWWSHMSSPRFHLFVLPTSLPRQASECPCQWWQSIEGQIKGAKMHLFYIVSHAEGYFASPWRVDSIVPHPEFLEWPYWGGQGDELHSRGLLGENKMAVCDMWLCWRSRDVSHGHHGVRTGYL